jgi:hypothetical protein
MFIYKSFYVLRGVTGSRKSTLKKHTVSVGKEVQCMLGPVPVSVCDQLHLSIQYLSALGLHPWPSV